MKNQKSRQKPDWLKIRVPSGKKYLDVKDIVNKHKLHTICTSGMCPNMSDCWERGTATLMILGDVCTRSCKFCAVKTGKPDSVDLNEPDRVAKSVELMKLKHLVLTSVDRDDLPDGGANIWAETISLIKKRMPGTTIEALVPDFQGKTDLLDFVIDSKPEIISHNLETVKRLTPQIRSVASYETSLDVLQHIANSGIRAKSGIMLGLGETDEEILQTMDDLLNVNCEVFTLGQYLQPTKQHLLVNKYYTPEEFKNFETAGLEKGFRFVESSPLVRSSFHAEKHIL